MRLLLFINLLPIACGHGAWDTRTPPHRREAIPMHRRKRLAPRYRHALEAAWLFLAWPIAWLLLAMAALAAWFGVREWKKENLARQSVSANLPTPVPQATIRALMGSDRKPYVDHSGNIWSAANYCQGGTNINVPRQRIEGTRGCSSLFRRGARHCPLCLSRYSEHV